MDSLSMWKEKMNKDVLVGCFVTFALPDIAEFTAMLGFDFLLIDNEHGVMEQSVLADMVRASQCAGVPAVVRCTEKSYDHIQKALDFGANGIQIPLVNTAEDARRVAAMSLFPPEGKRGVAFLPRAARYGLLEDKKAYLARANASRMLCCQVETKEALENLDEILAVEEIDVYFIGPGDLSTSVGMNTGDPEFLALVETTIKRITAAGKTAGYYVGSAAAARQAADWGAKYLVTAITPYMAAGARKFLEDVRTGEDHVMQVNDAY